MLAGLIALWVTMLLSGLWHGANYTFIVWAALHAAFSSIERLTKWNKKWSKSNLKVLLIPIIFVQAMVAWVYFRSEDISQANLIVTKLFSFNSNDFSFIHKFENAITVLCLAIFIESMIYMRKEQPQLSIWYKNSNLDIALVSLSIISCILFRGEGAQFIYFQF